MTIRSRLEAARRQVLCSLYPRTVPLGNRGPIVSFSFDDFPRTAYTVGGGILKGLGVRGTYYAAIGVMNTSNELGDLFRPEDLISLIADGHEVASHTFSHISCRSVSCSAFREEIEKGRRAIQEITGVADSGNFAYPFGDVTLKAKKAFGPHMISCRSIFPGFNGPNVDLNLLRANCLCGDLDKSEQVQKLILENNKRNSWLIFYSHDVRLRFSAFGCSPSLFELAVSFAVRQGSRILTIGEVVAETGGGCIGQKPR
jgi:peptidoglycan/xylan/chitin deacetylase (PgdA/CDA1 family)